MATTIDSKELSKALQDYIKDKHTQEECIGFIDGYQEAEKKYLAQVSDLKEQIAAAREIMFPKQF